MPKASLGWVAAALALAGCHSAPKTVKVDLALVAESDVVSHLGATPRVAASSGAAPPREQLFELRERDAARDDSKRAQRAQETLDRGRNAAMRALRERLYRSYAKEADAWRLEQAPKHEEFVRQRLEQVEEASSQLLQETAPSEGVRLAELSFLVGFPAPPPAVSKGPSTAAPWQVRRWERAQTLLSEIQALERSRAERRIALMAKAQEDILASRARVQMEYGERLDQALERANAEAEESARASEREFQSELAVTPEPPSINLPPIAVKSRSIEGLGKGLPDEIDAQRPKTAAFSRVRHDLEIWLALKGYRLARASEPGADATKEFIAWRRTHLPGR